MKVRRDDMIGGHPIKVVRDILADVGRGDGFYVGAVEENLQKVWWRATIDDLVKQGKLPREHRGIFRRDWEWPNHHREIAGVRFKRMPSFTVPARELVEALLKHGLIEEHKRDRDGDTMYCCTMNGHALQMTNFVSRINRSKAEALLTGALERVAEINRKAELLHWVTEVRVFGSYLTDTDDLGDLDLAIKMEQHAFDKTEDWAEARKKLAKESGKHFGSWHDMLDYPELQVRRIIKNRSPYISLHDTSELDKNPKMGGKTVYTFTPPDRPK
jgi:predicted nucleotidyltransferase